ncbi:hypothetical protein CMV30_15100 [Nibricoccus aquaticus]|uniref:GIY-YIG domain-containing protein n=1 Tax=Nibricoccus aquaticus TaxID=2576891 RepID=A0A290Q9I1_9BACT|nr:hypothetical protein [Nibricoccus aquaticus]ATC65174.1 hypothetical protein CMV30_15100 [Nibricoccus aquaticus]
MIHTVHFLTFSETALTQRWRWNEKDWVMSNGFAHPVTAKQMGKVYIFADERWPLYVGKSTQSIAGRVAGAFKATPTNRVNGFGGYRFKREKTEAFLHVFMGTLAAPWTNTDAECIEAEVVFRIRQAGAWPAYQTEIHFSAPGPLHETAADEIMNYFRKLKTTGGLVSPLSS